jgi:23S rRNA (pseudouridine1915-N3)-methyltransferase
MRVYIIAFGKLKNPGFRATAEHYLKMLGAWTKIEEIELRPETVTAKTPEARARVQEREATVLKEKLSQLLGPRGRFYLLDETGRARPTSEWAALVKKHEDEGTTELAFCIGGSLGFSPEFRKTAAGVLAFGPQTLSHELARVVLLEQVYRAWSVCRGHPYHNAE